MIDKLIITPEMKGIPVEELSMLDNSFALAIVVFFLLIMSIVALLAILSNDGKLEYYLGFVFYIILFGICLYLINVNEYTPNDIISLPIWEYLYNNIAICIGIWIICSQITSCIIYFTSVHCVVKLGQCISRDNAKRVFVMMSSTLIIWPLYIPYYLIYWLVIIGKKIEKLVYVSIDETVKYLEDKR